MVSHLIGVFWLAQDFLALTTLAPAQGGPLPAIVGIANLEWFQAGPFGVGLFFLISGLVIPISLEKHNAASFLAARLLRIYPTYIAGLAVQLLTLLVASHIWGQPLPYDWRTIFANAFLIQDLVGRPSIDLVNWTLTIELRFYVIVAVLAPWLRRASLAAVFGPALLACVIALLISQGVIGTFSLDYTRLTYTVSSQLPFMILMLVGVLFNYHVRGKLGTPGLLAGVAALAALMAFAWWFSVLRGQFTHVLNNDAYALALFSGLYFMRRHVPPNRVFDTLASISYPLYLVHATVGFVVMKALMLLAGVGYPAALAIAVLVAGAIAAVLHVAVELPSIRWGRRLAITPA